MRVGERVCVCVGGLGVTARLPPASFARPIASAARPTAPEHRSAQPQSPPMILSPVPDAPAAPK
eukprot:scaffold11415_cov56-Isochrysis_galbana.AAC.1